MAGPKQQRKGDAESPFMTPHEVASTLKLSHKTVCRRLADGTLPGIRIGLVWRCRRDAIYGLGTASAK